MVIEAKGAGQLVASCYTGAAGVVSIACNTIFHAKLTGIVSECGVGASECAQRCDGVSCIGGIGATCLAFTGLRVPIISS